MIASLKSMATDLANVRIYASVSSRRQNVNITVHGGAEVNNQYGEDQGFRSFTLPRGVCDISCYQASQDDK